MATTVTPISTQTNYNTSDEILLNPSITQSSFDPSINYIEYTISTPDKSFSTVNYNYQGYSFSNSGVTSNSISDIIINPEIDLAKNGFTSGEFNVYYNFLKNELSSSYTNQNLFIKDISPDRTEITLNSIDNTDIINIVNNFRNQLNSNPSYFQDFFLNFGNNNLYIANNINIDNDTLDIFINLYEPLPNNIQIKNTLWVVTQIADELAFNIITTPEAVVPAVTSFPLKGPNFNLPIKDQVNNSTDFQTYSSLITSSLLSTSYSQLNNLISSSGIEINIDYTDFSNFIHFSSAVSRINNFYYKKQLIDQYQQEINVLTNITSFNTTGNLSLLTKQINNIIENFDGYEYFLYYGTGSWSYPKSGSTIPYELYPAGSPQVLTWLGDAEDLTGILGSASLYDKSNLDYLYNTVPNFIQEDDQNLPYQTFIDMVAQHYDNIWVYYKDVSNRYNTDNRLDYGISKDLVASALKSFGVKLYQNNFSTNDLYSAFLGYGNPNPNTTGSLPVLPASGIEYIDNYLTASYSSPIPLDDVNKEVYKRLYHNLPYLAKTKGTIPGLRALINCFGVPDTILRISEFGGRDKDTSTYDYFDQKYNYSFYVSKSFQYTSFPLKINDLWGTTLNNPESIQFRFKTQPLPTSSVAISISQFFRTSSVLIFHNSSSNNYYSPTPTASLLALEYSGSFYASGAYSGSTYSSSYQYANLVFYPNIRDTASKTSISLPFYNNDWWSVMLNITGSDFTLYAGNKLYYDGYDGNQIGFLESSSITYDINYTGFSGNGGYFGSGSIMMGSPAFLPLGPIPLNETMTTSQIFLSGYPLSRQLVKGQYQELRYWSKTGSVEAFKDFIMNPSSIDYWGDENEYANYLAYRIPLGNELYGKINATGEGTLTPYLTQSVHPKVTGSWATASFNFNYAGVPAGLSFPIFYPNIEPFFYNQPIAGIKNRVTDKIQIVSSSYPTGSVLSQYRSIEQTYPTLGSETPDINLLEVAFSPQNEINNDIISSLGYFNIGEYIGDPRQVSSPATTYPDLVNLSNNFFQKYFASYDLFDYIRLIKYFDNSLFKMIKDFVPARTSLASGVVIKQHLLERNKYPEPQVEWEELDYSGSVDTAFISGGTGGTFDSYNFTGSIIPPTFINNTQSWSEEIKTPVGLLTISHSTQDEFYNGELPYSDILVSNGELNEANPFKEQDLTTINYDTYLYKNSVQFLNDPLYDITDKDTFLNSNTSPNAGEIYLWYDDSVYNIGAPPITNVPYNWDYYSSRFSVERVKYIKINFIDSNGVNNFTNLSQLQNLTLSFPDGIFTYPIYSIQENNGYFLYSIGPYLPIPQNGEYIGNPNTSSLGGFLDYEFSMSLDMSGKVIGQYFSAGMLPNIFTASISPTGSGIEIKNNVDINGNPGGYYYFINPTQTPNCNITATASLAVINNNSGGGSIRNIYFSFHNPLFPLISSSTTVTGNGGASSQNVTLTLDLPSNFITGSAYVFNISTDDTNDQVSFSNDPLVRINQSPEEFTPSQSLAIFDPYLPQGVFSFDYNDYNPLLDNAEEARISNVFMDIDYSQNPIIPINQSLIVVGGADRAPVQDSNYSSKAWSNIRYNGSRYNSIIIKTKPRIGNNITQRTNPFGG